jgi:hypothetical protein
MANIRRQLLPFAGQICSVMQEVTVTLTPSGYTISVRILRIEG